jgi:hypothetical protein
MARTSARDRFVAILLEHEQGISDRYADLCVSLRVEDVEVLELVDGVERWRTIACGEVVDGKKRWKAGSGEELIRLGGRWDRRKKRWAGNSTRARIIRVHRGQERAARWLADWFRCKLTGRWADFRRVWWALFNGGRRSGKSHMAIVALIMYAVAFPGAIAWGISPTQEETDELEEALRSLMPREWYRWRGAGAGKVSSARLPNGSRIMFLSGHKPRNLKRGRVDIAVYNEAQNQHKAGFTQLRGAIADRGGLIIAACNPPDSPIGRWVEDLYNAGVAGKVEGEVFDFRPKENPWINYQALASMATEVDERTFRREVDGEFVPIGDIVFYTWSDRENWIDPPPSYVDITARFTLEQLGRSFGYVVGMDFQQSPHMAARVFKFFADPEDPSRTPLPWIVDEFTPENADEYDLVDALESTGRWTPSGRLADDGYRGWSDPGDDAANPAHCCVVMDASGFFQDGAHTKGKTSDMALRSRGWKHLYKPQKDSDKNPEISERAKVGNSLLKPTLGRRRLHVARHCSTVAGELRQWENRNGAPYRRSPYAHGCDADTYPLYRFFGRPKVKRGVPKYDRVKLTRADEMRGI